MPIDRMANNWSSLVALVYNSFVSILSRTKKQTSLATPQTPLLTQTHSQSLTQIICTNKNTTSFHSLSTNSFYTTTNDSFTSFTFYSTSSASSFIHLPTSITNAIASAVDTSAGNHLLADVKFRHFDDSRVYRRLLVQLEETERNFDEFWTVQLTRMQQCLDLRRFEFAFRELQVGGFRFRNIKY